ncbi:hypothetical protein RHMOL_Rhmol11G0074600 [Rhododendron molle]|uniref:Uncharacterized protein n=1 Tax=Rhododendron molle TaxID=49168 RepID=A0ACC0LPZ6_RHOML|nr:hypothetical protein RHMOL_Rhmol11G0074600 [Rhododendron molle]
MASLCLSIIFRRSEKQPSSPVFSRPSSMASSSLTPVVSVAPQVRRESMSKARKPVNSHSLDDLGHETRLPEITQGSPVTRWASVAFGAGVGIGSAYTECSYKFDGSPAKLATPKTSDSPLPVIEAGANALVTGSAVFGAKDYAKGMDSFWDLDFYCILYINHCMLNSSWLCSYLCI